MKKKIFRLFGGAVVAGAFLLLRGEYPNLPAVAQAAEEPPVGYANPAAVYCSGLGYTYEIQHKPTGDVGICKLPDASVCDEWDFLAGKCGAKYSVCAQKGYSIETRSDGNNPYTPEYAVCVDGLGKSAGTVVQFANLEEKATNTGCTQPSPLKVEPKSVQPEAIVGTLPSSFDWRVRPKGNYVTNVRNQGGCGSCWAFSAVGSTEAALNIATNMVGNNYDLAEEYLVSSCSNAGTCCGGWLSSALSYIQTSGLPDEACMPYVDGDWDGVDAGCQCSGIGVNTCSASCTYRDGGQCSDKTCGNRCSNYATRLVKLNSVGLVKPVRDTIKNMLISKGPLSVSLSMEGSFSANGIYHCGAGAMVDHAVVVVGYNDTGGYWIVKNSWGSTWNGNGYFKVGYGQCGIEREVYYATVARVLHPHCTKARWGHYR